MIGAKLKKMGSVTLTMPIRGSLSMTVIPRPTQPFILSKSINWVVSNFIG